MQEKWNRLKKFTKECIRVLKVMKKPDKEELKTIIKVTGLGITILGIIGLIMQMINQTVIQ